jgi:hypothetical protein
MYVIQHFFICRPSNSTVSEDAWIEPRTVATLALTARRSNHSARSHPRTNIAIGLTAIGLKMGDFYSFFNEFPRKLIKRLCPYCAVGVPADASAVVGISTISGIPALAGLPSAIDVCDVLLLLKF